MRLRVRVRVRVKAKNLDFFASPHRAIERAAGRSGSACQLGRIEEHG
jgi:hypothetical protein